MSTITKSMYIGPRGAAWERVCLAFQVFNLRVPQAAPHGSDGAYVLNILEQYSPTDEQEIMAVVNYGFHTRRETLESQIKDTTLAPSLEELVEQYRGEQDE